MRKVLDNLQQRVTEQELRELIAEVDTNRNQTIEFDEFVQLIASLKAGTVTDSRFGALIQQQDLRGREYPQHSNKIGTLCGWFVPLQGLIRRVTLDHLGSRSVRSLGYQSYCRAILQQAPNPCTPED